VTAPGVTPAPLPSGLTLEQWIADGRALVSLLDQFLPADVQAVVALVEDVAAAGVRALAAPAPDATLQAEVDAEQAAGDAAEKARFPNG